MKVDLYWGLSMALDKRLIRNIDFSLIFFTLLAICSGLCDDIQYNALQ